MSVPGAFWFRVDNHAAGAQVAKQACFFLANISGNDKCKESIREGSGHIAIVQAMPLHARAPAWA